MSHLEEKQSSTQIKKKKDQKSLSLVDFISDHNRDESLVGLQHVVEVKMLNSDMSVVKCNLCAVKGKMATMKEHLVGVSHIRLYMEKNYSAVLQSLRRSCQHKSQFAKMLKDYAKEIERAEGVQSVNIEYVSAADMKKEQDNWMAEQGEKSEGGADKKKLQVLDKRQLALNYSETFKIVSREEATMVLNLTQRLSDQLEQYFLKYKGLDFLDSAMPVSVSTNPTPERKDLPPIHHNPHPISAANPGLNKEMQRHVEEPPSSVYWTDRDARGVKRKPEMHGDVSHGYHVHPESSSASDFQDRAKRQHREPENSATMHSSLFYMNDMGLPQYSSPAMSSSSSSSIAPTYTHFSAPETFGGELQKVKDAPPHNVSDKAPTSNVDADRNTEVPGLSSSSSHETTSEKPASSQSQGKTSKALSPDILQLLKGKDANTVTNILRTLSPFYPALQDINVEMLAQVLVNTGVLD